MKATLKTGETITVTEKIAKYSELFTQLVEDEDFFKFNEDGDPSTDQPEDEILKLELTQLEYSKFLKFCARIDRHLEESGYKTFKANHFFSEEYFKGFTDEELLSHYKIAEYLHSDVLKESLNWFLGGLFLDMDVSEIEDLYLGKQAEEGNKISNFFKGKGQKKEAKRFTDEVGEFAALEYSEILNEKLVKELKTSIEKFDKEDISFLDEWLIADQAEEGQQGTVWKDKYETKTGPIKLNDH